MSYGKHLSRFSSVFFFIGFVAAKLQYLPFYLFSFIISIFSLACYLTGYLLWLGSSFLHSHSAKHSDFWHGFASFTIHHKFAASLGVIATICFFIALTSPFVAIPAVWLFAASNTMWSKAEYHKWMHPPKDNEYSSNRQSHYLQYALLTTSVSFVTAFSVTLSMIFPLSAFAILTGAAIISLIVSIQSLNSWASVNLSNDKPDCALTESYLQIVENLGKSKTETLQSSEYEKVNRDHLSPSQRLNIENNYTYLTNPSANETNVQIESSYPLNNSFAP